MSEPSLHLLHTRPDPRHLAAWATRHGLLQTGGDLGYALHGLLHAAFGDAAPRPFRYLDAEEGLLCYTGLDADEVERHVAVADPQVVAALGLGSTRDHPGFNLRRFPLTWPQGHQLSFEVRVRPVIREGRTGKERDAFLAAVEKSGGGPVDREAVYVQWLQDQLALRPTGPSEPWQGAVEIVEGHLERFSLLDVMRRTQPTADQDRMRRQGRAVSGPDAVLDGQLRVLDPQAFSSLLRRGVGRHRAFGFGMLMLRPASRSTAGIC